MLEKEIFDYLKFGNMVTAIEAEFSHIAIGDAHTNIQLLEQFPFGKISEDTKQLRTDAFCELYGMIGSAFHSACQLIINKDEPIILLSWRLLAIVFQNSTKSFRKIPFISVVV